MHPGLLLLGGTLLLAFVAVGLGAALKPLLAAFAVAYLVFPVVQRLERRGVDRRLAVFGVLLLLVAILALVAVFLLPVLWRDAQAFVLSFPRDLDRVLALAGQAAGSLGLDLSFEREAVVGLVRDWLASLSGEALQSAAQSVLQAIGGVVGSLVLLLNLFLFPVFFYFVLADYERIRDGVLRLVPRPWIAPASRALAEADQVLSGYLRGQVTVALILSGLYAVTLALVGVPYAWAIGVLTGLLSIIPYVGFTVGSLTAFAVALATGGGWPMLAGIGVGFALVQTVESLVLTPRLVGDKVGLSALETLLALTIGGNLAGLAGMLVAIPLGGMLKMAVRAAAGSWFESGLYKGQHKGPDEAGGPEASPGDS